MTWQETHARWQAIREIEVEIEAGPAGVLPWNERYEQIFHTRAELVAALEYRWRLIVQAQMDPELCEDTLAKTFRDITLRHAPLLGVLDRYARGASADDSSTEGATADVHV